MTTATKAALRRVYAIKNKPQGTVVALIRAISAAQALAHHLKPILDVESASQENMVAGFEAGLKVQNAGEVTAPTSAPAADADPLV